MSIVTLKNKSKVLHGSTKSGKQPGGIWLSRGPFGKEDDTKALGQTGPSGFSINGGRRNCSYVGKTYAFSQNGTPFKGLFPKGNGGCCGTYKTPLPLFNSGKVVTRGAEYEYIKPSVLSSRGMINTKYRWIRRPYPYTTVQPIYASGPLSLNASQEMYINKISSANHNNFDINEFDKYNEIKCNNCSYMSCSKKLRHSENSSDYLHRKKLACTNIEPIPIGSNGNNLRFISFNV